MIQRFLENPILKPSMITPSSAGMAVECTLNPGAFEFNGQTWLLVRVAERPVPVEGKTTVSIFDDKGALKILSFDNADPDLNLSDARAVSYRGTAYLSTLSHLRLLCSDDGVHFHEPKPSRSLTGMGSLETYGIEDCRVALIEGRYYLTFTAVSENGVGVGMISTRDWQTFKRHGMMLPPHNKDCALFEEKVNDKFWCLHRPSSPELGGNYIWLASSPDLDHWGNHVCIARTRPDMWDSGRIGAGCSPIKTEKGWLIIYHGATNKNRYCLGAMLLDLDDPTRVIARSKSPIMEPAETYETKGFFGEVIFTNGHVVHGDEITMYYGAADEVICGAKISIQAVLTHLASGG